MLEGMEHIECCGNCEWFMTHELRCWLGENINKDLIHFHWCVYFKVDKKYLHEDNKYKLIYNMARYIASKYIDFDICTLMINKSGCLMEKQYNDGVDCGLDICIECVKNWFGEDR